MNPFKACGMATAYGLGLDQGGSQRSCQRSQLSTLTARESQGPLTTPAKSSQYCNTLCVWRACVWRAIWGLDIMSR
jgi:hypothetical protein